MFRTVLVANRGEIAVRVIRTCKTLGIRCIAVFSDADRDALHVRMADDAYHLGEAAAERSYLAIDRLIAAARAGGAEAIHPGYGFLSENPDFARATLDAGIAFVGPDPSVIATMADKTAARRAAEDAGVPVLPGAEAVDAESAPALAQSIGFPLLVKAAFGGGGRGMRIARDESALATALADARREAQSSFGRSEVFLERFLDRARHVEVQVFGDRHGTIVHFGDRDCSVQRRHQKIVEEAPAPNLDDATRASLRNAASELARKIGYVGAGTVEFLVEAGGVKFFFLEMNTRLQVEHGVSELITGVDFVELQLRIASGESLGVTQGDVEFRGHAIQARIAAEDPTHGFRPSAGRINRLTPPSGPWLRADFGVEAGDEVSPFYDSMIGKILAWGPSRDDARRRLARAVADLSIAGVQTNQMFLSAVLDAPAFVAATHDARWIDREPPALPASTPTPASAVQQAPLETTNGSLRRHVFTTPQGVVELDVFRGSSTTASRPHQTREASFDIGAGALASSRAPVAPIDGVIVMIAVAPGDAIVVGQTLAVLEAMKMDLPIAAGCAGVVEEVRVETGATVKAGAVLLTIAPSES